MKLTNTRSEEGIAGEGSRRLAATKRSACGRSTTSFTRAATNSSLPIASRPTKSSISIRMPKRMSRSTTSYSASMPRSRSLSASRDSIPIRKNWPGCKNLLLVVECGVLTTKKGDRNGSELVEISLGSDVWRAKGHKLYVYRAVGKGKYLGTIRLDMVDYRTAVGVVIQSSKSGEIQRGDDVTTNPGNRAARTDLPRPWTSTSACSWFRWGRADCRHHLSQAPTRRLSLVRFAV